MPGVQYDISVSGGGVDVLGQLLGLVQQNTNAVQQLTGVMSAFAAATNAAVSNISGTSAAFNQATGAANTFGAGATSAINQASSAANQLGQTAGEIGNKAGASINQASNAATEFGQAASNSINQASNAATEFGNRSTSAVNQASSAANLLEGALSGDIKASFNVVITTVNKLESVVDKLTKAIASELKPSFDKLTPAVKNANVETKGFEQSIDKLSASISVDLKSALDKLTPGFTSVIAALTKLEGVVEKLAGVIGTDLKPSIDKLTGSFNNSSNGANKFKNTLEALGNTAFHINNIRDALQGVTSDLNNAVQPGINLDTQLKQMQAVTQVTDAQLDQLSASARENAKAFGVEASKAAAGYQVYLAGLGPEIAKVPEALAAMGEDATVLSKQMAGDVEGAAGVLTTAVQQFGVSLDDPTKAAQTMTVMMNIMSAAAREGSAELPDLKSALEQAGMMAKTANVSFAETNSALEILANSGKKGAEGGVALRNVMSILSEGEFLPKPTLGLLAAAGISVDGLADQSKTLAERLALLKPISGDVAAMTQLFGRENVAAGVALVNNSTAIADMTGKIVGTNAAYEQADIIMGSYEERQNRITAAIQDFGIKIFEATEAYLPFINMGMGALQVLSNLAGVVQLFGVLANSSMIRSIGASIVQFGTWIATVVSATAAQMGLNVALSMNPIGLVVIAVAAAVAAIALLISYWDEIWAAIKSFAAWIWEHHPFKFLIDVVENIFPGFKAQMGALWDWVAGKFEDLIGWFKKAWDWIKSLFGAGKDAGADAGKSAVEGFNKSLKDAKIEGITVQGAANNTSPLKNYTPGGKPKGTSESGKSISKGSTSGGNRPTNITITIQKLQDQLIVNAGDLKQAAKQAGKDVVNEIFMALSSVDQKGGLVHD